MNAMAKGRTFAIILFSLIVVSQSFADYSPLSVPDSSEIRKTLVNSWFTRDYDELAAEKSFVAENFLGEKFQVRMEDLGSEFAIVVAPSASLALEVHTDTGIIQKSADVYPFDNPGSWVLYRNKETGKPVRICYFFQTDNKVFVQIRPDKNKSSVDMVIYNTYPIYGLSLGLPIENYYALSFTQFYKLTSHILPWHYFSIEKDMYNANLQMIGVIREHLPRFTYTSDAAFDHAGRSVFISSGELRGKDKDDLMHVDTAGFAKWVVDGLVYAHAGSYLNLEPLKRETVQTKTGTMAQSLLGTYNIFFSLDWTRNLAAAWLSIISDKDIMYENTGVEVTLSPFAAVQTDRGVERSLSYIAGTGYSASLLKSLMYVLAVTEPERMYLGAVRQSDGNTPEVVYYNEAAVFFPFFDDTGLFHCIVYEGSNEMTIDDFIARWQGSFVNLVRLKTSQRFFPQNSK